jgi:hypothetical protein
MKRSAILLSLLASLGGGWWWCVPKAPAVVPCMPDEFFKALHLKRVDGGELLPETLTLQSGSGIYVKVELDPQPKLPNTWDGEVVTPMHLWPMEFRVDWGGGNAPVARSGVPYVTPVEWYYPWIPLAGHPDNPIIPTLQRAIVQFPRPAFFTKCGYREPLRVKYGQKPQPDVRWFFVAIPPGVKGCFDYELVVYPATKRHSAIRHSMGPRVVLRRGQIVANE